MKKRKLSTKPYYELLKDPRWQRRRLEIFERDKFACTDCGDKAKTLHVHHRRYDFGKMPWEYEDGLLVTVCEDCHERLTTESKAVKAAFAEVLGNCWNLPELLGSLQGFQMGDLPMFQFAVLDYEQARGIGVHFGLTAEDVLAAAAAQPGRIVDGFILSEKRKALGRK